MRSPLASASLMSSRMCLTANSTSLAGKCFWLRAIDSISSDFVMSADSQANGTRREDSLRGHLLLEQVSEGRPRRRSRRVRLVVLQRLRFLVGFLRLDRQRDHARLPIHAGELRLDGLADFQDRARVLDAITRDLGGSELADDAVVQRDGGHLRVELLDNALDDAALRMLRKEQRERILVELLDAERDPFALRVDREHHGLELLTLLVVAHGFLAGHVPG